MASKNTVNYPIQYVKVDTATSGDNTLLASVTGQKIYVYSGMIVAAGAMTTTLKDGTTTLTGAMTMATGTPLVFRPTVDDRPLWIISGNFVLNLSGATQVSGYFYCAQG